MKLLARITSDGTEQTLAQHLVGVSRKCRHLLDQKPLRPPRVSADGIVEIGEILGAAHDFGKGTSYFQRYLCEEYQGQQKQHSSISAYFAYDLLIRSGYSEEIALLGWVAIQRHHGDLTSVFTHQGEIHRKADDPDHRELLQNQAKDIRQNTQSNLKQCYEKTDVDVDLDAFLERVISGNIFDKLKQHKVMLADEYTTEDYYLLLLMYSVLLDADRVDSAGIELSKWPSVGSVENIATDAVKQYRDNQLSVTTTLDRERQRAANVVSSTVSKTASEQRLFSLTMPTGSGKTLNALDAALTLRETAQVGRPPRVIYAAPFLSIIDQNHDVFNSVLKTTGHDTERPDVLLRHDHRSPGYASVSNDLNDDIDEDFLKYPGRQLLLTEGWNAEVVTTTFVQLFNALLTRQNKDARRFHKLAGSVLLLDEIQAIPSKYWDPLKQALRILSNRFGTRIILLTATNPLLFDPEDEIVELSDPSYTPADDPSPDFHQFDRVTYNQQHRETSQTISELADQITNLCHDQPEKDLMTVLNTVTSTKELYSQIESEIDRKIIYLSTRILPRDRAKRIEKIKQSDDPILVITTQLVEAGVDIDLDIVIRDFAPIDCLVQTAGRCNREAIGDGGTVYITKLRDTRANAPREYHYQYVYDNVLTDATRDVLDKHSTEISEQTFNTSAITEYFELVQKRKETDKDGLLESMQSLELDYVDPSLIQESYRTVSVFVMRDRQAKDAYKDLEQAYKHSRISNNNPVQAIKSEFYRNTINVPVGDELEKLTHLPSTFIDEIKLVEEKHIGMTENDWYHTVTGFQIPTDHIEFRII